MVDLLPNSLEEIIALRLELTQQEKLVIKESIDVIDGKIKSAINHIGQRPKETASELVATMNKLEHTHNTTPSTNAAERVFMYDMKKLQEKKKYLVEFNLLDSALSDLKLKRTGLQKELREKDASLDELYLGSRKLKLADKLGCSAGEIIEVRYTVPVDKLSQIIGKSGTTLQKIEAECKVSLDASESKASTETKVGNIRLTGTELSIATAKEAIAVIVSTVITEIPLSAEICACLILDKNARAHEVESEFDVRIDVSKAKKLCKVTGQGENVESAIKEIRAIPALKIQIPIDLAIIPFVVGKGGATINALAEGNKVVIDVDKTLKLIVVCGYAEDTKRAASILLDIISDNTEVEEIFKINKDVLLGCIVGTGGQNIRSLQRELGVQMQTEKLEKGAPKAEKGKLETLTIKGATSKVIVAKAKVLELLAQYEADTDEVQVPDDLMALVVGKKGVKITQFREKYPDANIDIDGSSVKVHCTDASTRQAFIASIDELVKLNFTTSVPINSDLGIAMKGARGADVRTALSALNLQFDIIVESGCVKIKGLKENVISGLEALEGFIGDNYTIELKCHEDDFSTIFNLGNTENSVKALEAAHRVEMRVLRKESAIRIRGERNDVESAKEALEGLLHGDVHLGSTVFPIDTLAFASIIGKAGATLKKFETDNDVKVDLLKSRGLIRIRGSPDLVQAAKINLIKYVDDIKANFTVELATLALKDPSEGPVAIDKKAEKIIEAASSIYQIEINTVKSSLVFRGNLYLVEEAKAYIRNAYTDSCTFTESFPASMLDAIRNLEKDIDLIRAKHSVEIEIMPKATTVADKESARNLPYFTVKGPVEAVNAAKVLLFKLLKRFFPTDCSTIPLPASCIRDLGNAFPHEIAQSCWGTVLSIDRPMGCVRLMGEEAAIADATKIVQAKLTQSCDHHASVAVEEYMLPTIIGKNGSAITALQKELHIKIHLNRSSMLLELETTPLTKPEVLAEALKTLKEKIAKMKQHVFTTTIPLDVIGLFVGKQGIRINKIRTDSGANIEINKGTGVIELRGTESAVAAGKELVLEIIKDLPTTVTVQMAVPARAFPFIIGPKGSKAAEITEASGARFDIDRSNSCVVLKGNPDACQKLKELIEEIMESEGITGTPAVVEETAVVRVVDTGHVKDFGPIPGAAYDPIAAAAAKARAADMGMSKSAIRRRRRKEQDMIEKEEELSDLAEEVESNGVQGSDDADQDEDSNEEDENDEEDEDESEYSESPAITTPDEEEEAVPQVPIKEMSAPINTKRSATDTAIASRTPAAPVGIIGRSPTQASKPIEVSKTATNAAKASTAEQKEVYEKSYNHFNPLGFTLPLQTPDTFYDAADTIAVTPVVKEEKKPVAVVTPKVVPAVVVPKISPAVVAPKVAPAVVTPKVTPAVVTPKVVPAVASTPVPANRGASSGLLDMLLGYNTPLPTTTKHEQQPALTVKLSQEHERAAATPTTAVPSLSKPTPAASPAPAIARETEAVENRKSGYYKSKTGFSVRL